MEKNIHKDEFTRETLGVLFLFCGIFGATAAVFCYLLGQAELCHLELNGAGIPWWVFFVLAFLCGAYAGLKHIAATMVHERKKKDRLMKLHFNWWVAAALWLLVAFWVFVSHIFISWFWLFAGAGVLVAILLTDRK